MKAKNSKREWAIVLLFASGLIQIAFIFSGLTIAIIPLVSILAAIVLLMQTLE